MYAVAGALGSERALQNSKLWKIALARKLCPEAALGIFRWNGVRERERGRTTPSVFVPLEIRSASAFFNIYLTAVGCTAPRRSAARLIFTTLLFWGHERICNFCLLLPSAYTPKCVHVRYQVPSATYACSLTCARAHACRSAEEGVRMIKLVMPPRDTIITHLPCT